MSIAVTLVVVAMLPVVVLLLPESPPHIGLKPIAPWHQRRLRHATETRSAWRLRICAERLPELRMTPEELVSRRPRCGRGRRLRILAIVDDYTRECLALMADTSISGVRVGRELDKIVAVRGRPGGIVSDNAPS